MSAHTPGPWRVTGEINRFSGGEIIRPTLDDQTNSPVAFVCDFNRYDRDAERAANARLIAAAPELLAAAREAFEHSPFHQSDCKGVAEYIEGEIFDDTVGCDCYLSRLKTAIAEAEGHVIRSGPGGSDAE